MAAANTSLSTRHVRLGETLVATTSRKAGETLDFALDLARDAGAIALRYFGQSGVLTEKKHDGTFVTQADREAEAFLRKAIADRYPDDGIIGEEFGIAQGRSGHCWIVDPIDGTFSFVSGVPLFGVLIGVEEDGEVVAGVAHFPALDQTIAAARGEGCRLNGRRVHASAIEAVDEALVLCGEPLAAQ